MPDINSKVYLIGHLQNSEVKGVAAFGHGYVCSRTDTTLRFVSTDHQGDLWLPGSAGFDAHGNISFMVIDSDHYDTSSSESPKRRRPSFFKRGTQNVQLGVPIQAILEWMVNLSDDPAGITDADESIIDEQSPLKDCQIIAHQEAPDCSESRRPSLTSCTSTFPDQTTECKDSGEHKDTAHVSEENGHASDSKKEILSHVDLQEPFCDFKHEPPDEYESILLDSPEPVDKVPCKLEGRGETTVVECGISGSIRQVAEGSFSSRATNSRHSSCRTSFIKLEELLPPIESGDSISSPLDETRGDVLVGSHQIQGAPFMLKPEEISRRIQGYGNVSNLVLTKGVNAGANQPSMINRLLADVGSSFVSGKWMIKQHGQPSSSDERSHGNVMFHGVGT